MTGYEYWAEVDRRTADIEAFEAAERGRAWKEAQNEAGAD